MLDDVPGLLNPIIQAMVHTADLKRQYAQQDIEKERNKQEADARKEQLKQAQQVIDYTHEHNLAQLEAQHLRDQADIASTNARTVHQLNIAGAVGVRPDVLENMLPPGVRQALSQQSPFRQQNSAPTPQANVPDGSPAPQLPVQGGGTPYAQNQPIFSTPQAEAQRLYNQTKLESQGKAEGALPSEQTLAKTHYGYQKQLQDAQEESQQKIAAMGRESQEKIAGMSRSTQMAIANMENKTRLQVAGMGGDEQSQNLIHSLMIGGMTGEIKLNPANPLERLAYSNLQQAGARTIDPKEIQALKDSQQLLPLFDKLENFAKTLPTGTGSAALQGYGLAAAKAVGVSTDMQNKLNIINSQAMNIGRSVEGLGGRPLAAQLKLDLDSITSGSISRDQAIDRINNLRDLYVNKQNNVIFGGMPEAQKEIIKQKYGVQPIAAKSPQSVPDWLRIAPKTNASGHTLDPDASLKFGQPVYK